MRSGKVTVSKGLTINLGNYESARIDVGVEVPVDDMDSKGLQEAYRSAAKFVNARLNQEVEFWSDRRKASGSLELPE